MGTAVLLPPGTAINHSRNSRIRTGLFTAFVKPCADWEKREGKRIQ